MSWPIYLEDGSTVYVEHHGWTERQKRTLRDADGNIYIESDRVPGAQKLYQAAEGVPLVGEDEPQEPGDGPMSQQVPVNVGAPTITAVEEDLEPLEPLEEPE